MNKIITIGREFGSGGRELGKRIAEELNIPYYDKEIITEVAKKTDLALNYVNQVLEKKPIVYYPITVAGSFRADYVNPTNNNIQIFAEQCNVLKELASKSSCVIVGRCADYILKDMNPYRIFVYSDMESKIKRCKEKNEIDKELSDKEIKKMIKNIDKDRSKYYSFYTSLEWGNKLNYDLCINTSGKEIKDVVNEILAILK